MKILKIVVIAAFTLASAGANAGFIFTPFMSEGGDDVASPARSDPNNGWIDPTGNDLDGADWVAPDANWLVVGDYSVWEVDDLSNQLITSLFVSYDDTLIIKIGGVPVWDSNDHGSSGPWAQIFNVIDDEGPLQVGSMDTISFYVNNTGGPTGVIWKGMGSIYEMDPELPEPEITPVPEPGTLALLGLGLAGMGMTRRKKKV